MSNYTNFIEDFPTRCCEVMEQTDWAAIDREVTVSLMTASAAFLIPFERMKPLHPNQLRPAPSEPEPYPNARKDLKTLLNKDFTSSILYNGSDGSWRYCLQSWLMGEVDIWAANATPIQKDKKVRHVLTIIRNGLAHGNVEVRGGETIEELVFASENRRRNNEVEGYEFLTVSPADFILFLRKWFEFLKGRNVPQKLVFDTLVDEQLMAA